jgi:hypothetical protein
MKLESAEPRIFGVVPPALALVLGLGALVVGIVLLASGAVLATIIWLAAGLALIALAIDASRRWPASMLPRLAVKAADGAGRHIGLARVTAGAWGEASRRIVSLRHELRSLRSEREERLSELGEASYRGDQGEVRRLRNRIASIDERLDTHERELDQAPAGARRRVQEERVAVKPTREFAVAEEPPPLGKDETTRTAPTARRRSPSAGRA